MRVRINVALPHLPPKECEEWIYSPVLDYSLPVDPFKSSSGCVFYQAITVFGSDIN